MHWYQVYFVKESEANVTNGKRPFEFIFVKVSSGSVNCGRYSWLPVAMMLMVCHW